MAIYTPRMTGPFFRFIAHNINAILAKDNAAFIANYLNFLQERTSNVSSMFIDVLRNAPCTLETQNAMGLFIGSLQQHGVQFNTDMVFEPTRFFIGVSRVFEVIPPREYSSFNTEAVFFSAASAPVSVAGYLAILEHNPPPLLALRCALDACTVDEVLDVEGLPPHLRRYLIGLESAQLKAFLQDFDALKLYRLLRGFDFTDSLHVILTRVADVEFSQHLLIACLTHPDLLPRNIIPDVNALSKFISHMTTGGQREFAPGVQAVLQTFIERLSGEVRTFFSTNTAQSFDLFRVLRRNAEAKDFLHNCFESCRFFAPLSIHALLVLLRYLPSSDVSPVEKIALFQRLIVRSSQGAASFELGDEYQTEQFLSALLPPSFAEVGPLIAFLCDPSSLGLTPNFFHAFIDYLSTDRAFTALLSNMHFARISSIDRQGFYSRLVQACTLMKANTAVITQPQPELERAFTAALQVLPQAIWREVTIKHLELRRELGQDSEGQQTSMKLFVIGRVKKEAKAQLLGGIIQLFDGIRSGRIIVNDLQGELESIVRRAANLDSGITLSQLLDKETGRVLLPVLEHLQLAVVGGTLRVLDRSASATIMDTTAPTAGGGAMSSSQVIKGRAALGDLSQVSEAKKIQLR